MNRRPRAAALRTRGLSEREVYALRDGEDRSYNDRSSRMEVLNVKIVLCLRRSTLVDCAGVD